MESNSSLDRRLHAFYLALCRVDLLIEQIIRIDPNIPTQRHPISTSLSSRSIGSPKSPTSTSSIRVPSQSSFPITSNVLKNQVSPQNVTTTSPRGTGQPILPVLRKPPQQQPSSDRSSAVSSHENAMFKPIDQQAKSGEFMTSVKPTLVQPRPSSHTTSEESATVSLFLLPAESHLDRWDSFDPCHNRTTHVYPKSSKEIHQRQRHSPATCLLALNHRPVRSLGRSFSRSTVRSRWVSGSEASTNPTGHQMETGEDRCDRFPVRILRGESWPQSPWHTSSNVHGLAVSQSPTVSSWLDSSFF